MYKKYSVFFGSFESKNPNARIYEECDLDGREVEFTTKKEAFAYYNAIDCGIKQIGRNYIIDFAELWEFEDGMGSTLAGKQGEV